MAWMEEREKDLLPVPYFHVVFTLPREIAAIARQNPHTVYGILFKTSAQCLMQLAGDSKHLGAEIGVLSVLHTWGQNLQYHPHVHSIVPGGGLALNGQRWVSSKPGFFLPVRALGRLFRGKFLSRIKSAHERGDLRLEGSLEPLQDCAAFADYLRPLYAKEWVVYSKPPFGSPSRVLKYLSRYTHRVAISNGRLVGLDQGRVSFTWKDYANGARKRVLSLTAVEFLRRFLMHILPRGFVRIRHYGFLSNRHRHQKLARCRELMASSPGLTPRKDEVQKSIEVAAHPRCPSCARGLMLILSRFEPGHHPRVPELIDSS